MATRLLLVTVQPDGLCITEFAHTEMRQFTAKTAFLYATESDAWVGCAIAIDEYASGIQFAGQLLGQFDIARVDGRGEPEFTVIGQFQSMWRPVQ